MKASVIIPVWNGREYLPGCLDALLAQDYLDFEIIAVDNDSVDGSANLVAEKYPQVRLIRNLQNLGFAGGCNVGLQAAWGDVLVLLNQDTIVQPGWLQALAEALQRPEVGVVGCKILYPDGETIQHAGGWIEWPLALAYHIGYGERDQGQWDAVRPVDYVTGAAMAFRREVLEQIGGLDEGFWPAYFEDADFCYQARKRGYQIWYIPEATLIHYETTSLRGRQQISTSYHRGRLRFVLKHLPPDQILSDFITAEADFQRRVIPAEGPEPLTAAYLAAMGMVPRLFRRETPSLALQILEALARLYRSAWCFYLESTSLPRPLSPEEAPPALAWSLPPLREFRFRSSVPLVGPLIAGFRSLWYSVAARWAVLYLQQQQEAINRIIEGHLKAHQETILRTIEILSESWYQYLAWSIAPRTGEDLPVRHDLSSRDSRGE